MSLLCDTTGDIEIPDKENQPEAINNPSKARQTNKFPRRIKLACAVSRTWSRISRTRSAIEAWYSARGAL